MSKSLHRQPAPDTGPPPASFEDVSRQLFDSAPDPSYLVTGEGVIVAASDAALAQLGRSRQELEGSSFADIDDQRSPAEIHRILILSRDEEPQTFETVHKGCDGVQIPVEVRCRSFSAEGRDLFHLIARDATNRLDVEQGLRESEEKYRSLVREMRGMVWVVEPNGRLVEVNDRTCELLGYSRDELLQLTVGDIDRSFTAEFNAQLTEQLLQDESPIFETRLTTKDERQIPVEVQSVLIRYRNEWHSLSIIRDITLREEVERERIRSEKLDSVGRLAGGIAHDFNNLLLSLHGNIEMAQELLGPDDEANAYLDEADGALERATSLTQQFLTFSTGGEPIKKRLDLGDRLIDTAAFALRGTNALLESNIAADLLPVDADGGQLDQVVSNLVLNAQQAMPDGGTVHLTAHNLLQGQDRTVEIEVRDTGVGIPQRDLERIFDPYFTTKESMRGLGLAVCLSVVHEHGGSLSARSEPGEGSIFTVRLPAAPAQVVSADPAPADEPEQDTSHRILVMDDDDAVRRMLVRLLTRIGHDVSEASHGDQACERYEAAMLSDTPFDLVIMDLTIPGGMSGKETAKCILELDSDARMLASSGYATDPVMAQPERYGFCGAIAKPYRLAELRAEIDAATAAP